MANTNARYLQRILEGLPLAAEARDGTLTLSQTEGTAWAEFPLAQSVSPRSSERFNATFEAFRRGQRLAAEEIRDLGINRLLADPEIIARLVLNHSEKGDPLASQNWRTEGLTVVKRPTLSEEEGQTAWEVARGLPCVCLKTFAQSSEGAWTVNEERVSDSTPDEAEDISRSVEEDQFVSLARSIPTRPYGKPYSPPVFSRLENGASWEAYRMTGA